MKFRLVFLALLFSSVMIAQVNGDRQQNRKELKQKRQERIENLKIAYITKELNLTSKESEKFWPIYNKYQLMLQDARQSQSIKNRSDELSEEEASDIIKEYIENEYKRAEIQEKKINELIPIIGNNRVIELYMAEAKFKKEILNRSENRNARNRNQRNR